MEILDLKEGKMSAVQYFYQLLDPEIRRGVTICVVPSSNSEVKESGIGKLGEMLAGNGRKNMDDVTTTGNYNIAVCREDDERYPNELRNLKGMPSLLYYKGNIEIINQHKNIAAIGSRTLSEQGSKLAYRTGIKIAEEGFNLVNGLALGCDTLALKGALSVNGKCVVFLPCGLDRILPASNQKLAEEILEKGGCLLSEYPEKTAVQKYRYVERDRLQSGISQGVIVIEAEQNSGTMHTADFAMRQYKRLACYAYSLLQMSSGNQYLENTGKSTVLHDETGLAAFLDNIKQSQSYEQMKLPF